MGVASSLCGSGHQVTAGNGAALDAADPPENDEGHTIQDEPPAHTQVKRAQDSVGTPVSSTPLSSGMHSPLNPMGSPFGSSLTQLSHSGGSNRIIDETPTTTSSSRERLLSIGSLSDGSKDRSPRPANASKVTSGLRQDLANEASIPLLSPQVPFRSRSNQFNVNDSELPPPAEDDGSDPLAPRYPTLVTPARPPAPTTSKQSAMATVDPVGAGPGHRAVHGQSLRLSRRAWVIPSSRSHRTA